MNFWIIFTFCHLRVSFTAQHGATYLSSHFNRNNNWQLDILKANFKTTNKKKTQIFQLKKFLFMKSVFEVYQKQSFNDSIYEQIEHVSSPSFFSFSPCSTINIRKNILLNGKFLFLNCFLKFKILWLKIE